MDSRIGRKYIKGGIGYGGPCLDRDNVALVAMSNNIGAKALLAEATDQANRLEVTRLVELIRSKRDTSHSVGVLGLSYKPDTNVIDASQGLLLAQALVKEGFLVVAYDPAAMEEARQVLGETTQFVESAEKCIRKSDIIVICTPWKSFEQLIPETFDTVDQSRRPKMLVDCWRMLDPGKFAPVTEYVPLGVGPVA